VNAQRRVLFVCGSINQTTMLSEVSRYLPELQVRFTPYYADGLLGLLARRGLLEMTIAGQKRRRWCLDWLHGHHLPVDLDGQEGGYDLIVTCTDVVVARNQRRGRARTPLLVAVQEGILDPERVLYWLCRALPFLPRSLAGTAFTGLSGQFDRFCCASEGYREHLVSRGADASKLVVTGMPNFDDCERYRRNDFPHRGYVLICTSDGRETFKLSDSRRDLVRRAEKLAAGRPLFFKLHPNEDAVRATREILALVPSAKVFPRGSAEEMIAHCELLVTEWSSVAFVGLALGKEVHSNFGPETLRRLLPVQNGGASARNIAGVCRALLDERLGTRLGAPPEEGDARVLQLRPVQLPRAV
jgi:hypothetical protein